MRKNRYPGQTPSLLHRFHPKTLAIPFMLTLFLAYVLLSCFWQRNLKEPLRVVIGTLLAPYGFLGDC